MKRFLQKITGPRYPFPIDERMLQYLVEQLNGEPSTDGTEDLDNKSSAALGQLITDLLNFERMSDEKDNYSSDGRLIGKKILALSEKLQNQLDCVKWTPVITPPTAKRRGLYLWTSASIRAWNNHAGEIFILASYGLLNYLRRCVNCNKWLVASRRDQRFCSGVCRVSHFKKTPQGRARNRVYMRTYRGQPSKREEGRRNKANPQKGR